MQRAKGIDCKLKISLPPPHLRRKAVRNPVVKAVGLKSCPTDLMMMVQEEVVNIHIRSTMWALIFLAGFVPSYLRLLFRWRKNLGMPTLTHGLGERKAVGGWKMWLWSLPKW